MIVKDKVGNRKMDMHWCKTINAILFLAVGMLCLPSSAQAYWIKGQTAKLRGLDKITGRTVDFYVKTQEHVQFGSLQLTLHACFKRPPDVIPETAAFLQVVDLGLSKNIDSPRAELQEPIFSGWMFASSPALNGLEHSVYDFWVLDCEKG